MTHDARRLAALLGVAATIALAAASAGQAAGTSAIPSNAVARVGDSPIKRFTFDRWLRIASVDGSGRRPRLISYDPPKYARCVAQRRKTAGGRAETTARLKTQCRQEYEGLRDHVLQFLILDKWVRGEAAEQGVKLSAEQLEAEFQKARKDSFPKDSDFRKFLEKSGMTVADARFQTNFNSVYAELRRLAVANAVPVTDADIAAFYADHPKRFHEIESRDVRVILTRTRAQAQAARAALERGQLWRDVARKRSIDPASNAEGGLLRDVTAGTQERALDDAFFRAPKDKLRGPVKSRFGYHIFKVVEIRPARQRTLAEATPAIRRELKARNEQQADDAFSDGLRAKWRPRTTCRAGYVMVQCSNAPPSDAR